MTPKEKAEELVDKFMDTRISWKQSKLCALIAVDELIKIHYLLTTTNDTSPSINYWKDVKQELENL